METFKTLFGMCNKKFLRLNHAAASIKLYILTDSL